MNRILHSTFIGIVSCMLILASASHAPSLTVIPGDLSCNINRLQTNYITGTFNKPDHNDVGGQHFKVEINFPFHPVFRFKTKSCYLDTKLEQALPDTFVIPMHQVPEVKSATQLTYVGMSKFHPDQVLGSFKINCLVEAPDFPQTYKAAISLKTRDNEYVFSDETCIVHDKTPLATSLVTMMPLASTQPLRIELRGIRKNIQINDSIMFSPCQSGHHRYESRLMRLPCKVNDIENGAYIKLHDLAQNHFHLYFNRPFVKGSDVVIECEKALEAIRGKDIIDMRPTCLNYNFNEVDNSLGLAYFYY